jgi:predicted kinase
MGAAARVRAAFGWSEALPAGQGPALLILAGLPGTGKSHLAAAIAERHPVVIVRSDEVRKALYQRPTYTPGENGFVYLTCYALLQLLLRDGYAVVFDATNLGRDSRRRPRALAQLAGAPALTVFTLAPAAIVAQRLAARDAGQAAAYASDADWAIHAKLAPTPQFEGPEERALTVDTSRPLSAALNAITAFLRAAAGAGGGHDGGERAPAIVCERICSGGEHHDFDIALP